MRRRFISFVVAVVALLLAGIYFIVRSAAGHEERGFLCKVYTAPDGTKHKYSVFVPLELKDNEKPPLIVYLNGHGKNGNDGLLPLRDGLAPVIWETKKHFPFVAVFPQCNEASNWHPDGPDAQRALAIMEETAQEYHTDPDRVYLTGLSTGGAGVWGIGARHPERFAAIAPISAMPFDTKALSTIAKANMPIWIFYVRDDRQVPVEFREELNRELLKSGLSPRYTVVEGSTHSSWDIAFRMPAFFTWLLDQRRSKNAEQKQKFRLLLSKEGLAGWNNYGNGKWWIEDGETLVGELGESGKIDTAYLATEASFENFEFHVEFKTIGTSECSVCFRSAIENNSSPTGWKFVAASPESGSGGLYEIGGRGRGWLRATHPLAQRALRPGNWNDCRIRVVDQEVIVELNGWTAIEFQDSQIPRSGVITLETPSIENAQIRWRNPRLRELK